MKNRTPISEFSISGLPRKTRVFISDSIDGTGRVLACGLVVHRGQSTFGVRLDNGVVYHWRSLKLNGQPAWMFLADEDFDRDLMGRIDALTGTSQRLESQITAVSLRLAQAVELLKPAAVIEPVKPRLPIQFFVHRKAKV